MKDNTATLSEKNFSSLANGALSHRGQRKPRKNVKGRGIFITGTDTGVGKTIATLVVAGLLKEQGFDVGIMKPVQCAGGDARFLKESLGLSDTLKDINPYFADEPLSPHVAFARQGTEIDVKKVIHSFAKLTAKHEIVLVEGAGGLLVPIKKGYVMADLIADLDLDVVIVSRLGLGTINHTLLTIEEVKARGLNVKGIIFNEAAKAKAGIAEETNPDAIREFGGVPIMGTIPYMEELEVKKVVAQCQSRIALDGLFGFSHDRTKQLTQWDRQYLWHPFTQMQDWLEEEPLVIDQAKGCYLIDTQGRRYLDGVSSLWVNLHGHRKDLIDRRIKGQMDRLSHSTLLGLSNTPAVELAKELVDITPRGLEKVFYSDNGSSAVEVALKMAYQYWQNSGQTKKRNIVHLANSYHGDTLGSVSVGGIDLFHKVYRDLIFKTIKLGFPDGYRSPKGEKYPDYAFTCLDKFEQLLKKKHAAIAALIVEPIVQGAAGMIVWPEGILKRMHALCKKYDVLLIADEVATGFGRTGKMFACEHEGVTPDILCLAKGITAGYLPLAATLTTKKIFDGFLFDYSQQKTFFHGHTYTGNPLCCAAALANLEVFKKERVLEKLAPKIKYLSERLGLFYNLRNVGHLRQKGFMAGIELVKDRATKEPYPWEEKIGVRVCRKARERDVILRPLGNVIIIMPPLAMTEKELDKLLDVTYWAVKEVTQP